MVLFNEVSIDFAHFLEYVKSVNKENQLAEKVFLELVPFLPQ
jgi:hypothetical protein